jgi:tRNA U55 pseudouridine synthase TruB
MRLFYKEEGITMGQFMEKVKLQLQENHIPFTKLAFTARLDPMAMGVVPILLDNECKSLSKAIQTHKLYTVKVILGLQTDSDDVLGVLEKVDFHNTSKEHLERKVMEIQKKVPHHFHQKYHHFSTKMLNARRKCDIHKEYRHPVTLYQLSMTESGTIPIQQFLQHSIDKIRMIDPTKNFRQEDILSQWVNFNKDKGDERPIYLEYCMLELQVSSGFFVRQCIRDLSIELNIPMMCFQIHRVKVYENTTSV